MTAHSELQRRWNIDEARKAGNPDYRSSHSDWIDYAVGRRHRAARPLSCRSPGTRRGRTVAGHSRPRLAFTRRSAPPYRRSPAASSKCAKRCATARRTKGLSGLVASFEPGAYNTQATIGENLLFGTATGSELTGKELAGNAYFRSVLRQDGLAETLYKMGLQIAEQCDRTVRRPARRPSVLPATGLHDGGRHSRVPAVAAAPARQVRSKRLPMKTAPRSSSSASPISNPGTASAC